MGRNITGQSQKGNETPEMSEDEARAYLEKLRWPDGPGCVHCGSINVTRLKGQASRPGVLQCNETGCRKQFTVSVGTIYEDSHLPLAKWVKAFHLMASSKKGMSALQLQRNLGIGSYRTAWFMAHRIREAMRCDPVAGMLKGEVQVDETYVGGKPRPGDGKVHKRGRGTTKAPVLALVETNGNVHARHIERIDSKTLKAAMTEVVAKDAAIVTDEFPSYPPAVKDFTGGHYTVNHGAGEYVRTVDGRNTNTAESFFSLLKRGVYGTFHHISKTHLHRYCDEFSFRWNGRKITDAERREVAMRQVEGKRLFYKQPMA